MIEVVQTSFHFQLQLCHCEVHLQGHHFQCPILLYHFLLSCLLFVSSFAVLDLCISPLSL